MLLYRQFRNRFLAPLCMSNKFGKTLSEIFFLNCFNLRSFTTSKQCIVVVLISYVLGIISKLPDRNKSAIDELDSYLKRGDLIRKYNSGIYKNINNLISKNELSDIVLHAKKHFTDHGENFGTNFIAFAAPSMTGKTQMAFTIDSKLPLYFVTNHDQLIYRNFSKMSNSLIKFAREDYEIIKEEISLKDCGNVATVDKLDEIDQLMLQSLGLLKTLIMDAKEKNNLENISLTDWMLYFSNLRINHEKQIEPISIEQFQDLPDFRFIKNKFYVFIDEFHGRQELVLLRNLCRIHGITCVLASTNANVTNLFESSIHTSSRVENPSVWSVSVPSLPLVPKEVISCNLKLNEALDQLISISNLEDATQMKAMASFIIEQCEQSRPGLSTIISNFVINFDSTKTFNIDKFFLDLVMSVKNQIEFKKAIFANQEGMIANTFLMLGNQFNSSVDYSLSSGNAVFKVDSHFYYLKNPYTPGIQPYVLFQQKKRFCLFVCSNGSEPKEYVPQCYFNENERILLLACLIGGMKTSTSRIFFDATPKSTIEQYRNVNAPSLAGPKLENIVCASIIDSSHFTQDIPNGTLNGVAFDDFIVNILGNLDETSTLSRSERKKIILSHKLSKLGAWIKRIKVPFLFSANSRIPSIYEYLFPLNKSNIRFGEYTRTSNISEIDAVFEIFDDNDNKHIAIVECKNRNSIFNVADIHKNLSKAIKFSETQHPNSNCLVHFNFCLQLGDFNHVNVKWENIHELTSKNKINVYYLKVKTDFIDETDFKLNPLVIELASISDKLIVHENPKMISIVIDLETFQNPFWHKDFNSNLKGLNRFNSTIKHIK